MLKHIYEDNLVTFSLQFYRIDTVSISLFLNLDIKSSVLGYFSFDGPLKAALTAKATLYWTLSILMHCLASHN